MVAVIATRCRPFAASPSTRQRAQPSPEARLSRGLPATAARQSMHSQQASKNTERFSIP